MWYVDMWCEDDVRCEMWETWEVRDVRDDRDDDDNEQTRAHHATNDNARTSTVRAVRRVWCAVHTSLLFQKFE